MSAYRVAPAALSGRLRMPGDKSISQRIALLCAWAEGESVIDGYLDGEDARSTLQAMEALGARSWIDDQNRLHIQGVAGQLKPTEAALDLGNSGTGTRLLADFSRVVAYLRPLQGMHPSRGVPWVELKFHSKRWGPSWR